MDEAQFSSIESTPDVPLTGSNVGDNALDLSNPDSILSGTQRGAQNLGSPNLKIDSANNRIIVNDNTTDRVSFGHIGTGVNDWGLKVSQSGVNVTTATNNQLIFNSSQDIFKIALSGTATIGAVIAGSVATATVNHNLGFVPAIIGYIQLGGATVILPFIGTGPPSGTGVLTQLIDVQSVTSTTIIFESIAYSTGIGTGALTIKYYLLEETAT